MKIVKNISIIVPLIAVILSFALNKKSPNVSYTLSKGISITSFQGETIKPEDAKVIAQELVIKNLGNLKAENVRVTIKRKVIKYDVNRNFASDKPEIIKKDAEFSLLYPELPPDGNFTLIFSSIGADVQDENITIADQNGLCKPALSQSNSSTILSILLLSVIYLIHILFILICSFLRGYWTGKSEFKSYREIISKKKPFVYLTEVKLDEILHKEADKRELRDEAYRVMFQNTESRFDYVSAIDFLKAEKPQWMKLEDYETLKNTAQRVVKQYKFSELFGLLNMIFSNQVLPLEKPDCLDDREWSTILDIEKRLKK
ncbi:MAG: hypothetical protein PHV77_00510 [Candidatus Omnitrophica bacterium]|nr:hypothetical protein [Candidatus Omnitrophota bacterium]